MIQILTGSKSLTNWKSGYGNYYSWPAATAGTGTTNVAGNNAVASICPSGWGLPANTGADSLSALIGTKSGWTMAMYNGNASVFGHYIGSTLTTIYKGANFWPAAGNVYSGSLDRVGSYGTYWTRTVDSYALYIHFLFFDDESFRMGTSNSYDGCTVRCVADY